MEQLFEAFGIDWRLLIAQAINFGVLLAALTYFLYKPVMKTLDERKEKVAKGVEDAIAAEQKLSEADTVASERLQSAEGEAEAIVASARDAAQGERTRIVKDAEARAASVASDAEARAEELRAKAIRDSEKEIARLAILAAEKTLREKA